MSKKGRYSVAWSDGKRKIVEVKYLSDLPANQERFKERFAAMEDWARARGATFRVATERDSWLCTPERQAVAAAADRRV